MTLSIIVATDRKNAIGKNNQLLWHLPADLKFFKTVTMGHPVVMGRKTFQSIGRTLPGRKNIIITRDTNFTFPGVIVYNSLEAWMKEAGEEKVFVIGGADIYRQTLHHCSEVYRTLVDAEFDADTYFPEIPNGEFELIWEEKHNKDEKNSYDYVFQKWVRRK